MFNRTVRKLLATLLGGVKNRRLHFIQEFIYIDQRI